jgi:hypothetical protein
MFWKNDHIDFDNIPLAIYINFDWNEKKASSIDFSNCKYLIIWHHQNKDKDFENLPDIEDLEYLKVNWSSSTSLKGLSKYKSLKRLELHYCTKLETLDGIEDLNQDIEYIHIDQSKKLKGHERVTRLKELRTLCFNDCGVIENLDFLLSLPHLADFRFVNTNILNGNLMPLISHPTITNAGFLNKKHYSHKDIQVTDLLSAKRSTNAQQSVYKIVAGH